MYLCRFVLVTIDPTTKIQKQTKKKQNNRKQQKTNKNNYLHKKKKISTVRAFMFTSYKYS